jgi:CelD/BcsL family acetyltransferase involved in cellulose biosynthesis
VGPGQHSEWRLERIESLEQARGDWDRLAEGAGHPFATWEWVDAWWRFFGEGKELYSFICRDVSGEVVCILPMYVASTRPVRVARFIGYGSLRSPLCAPEDRPLAARGVHEAVGSGPGRCRLVYAEKMPGEQGWGPMVGGSLIATHADPVIRLNGQSWDEYLSSLSTKLRKKVGYEERRLARDHELSFRLTEDPARLADDMDILIRLHETRWGEETTGVFDGPRGLMHRELAAGMLARGWLRLWIEEVDGEPAAAFYGFRFSGSDWVYQLGRDLRYERRSVGSVLLGHVIREACNDGMREFRLLDGAAPYKLRFADDDYCSETRLVGGGAVGRVATLAASAVQSAPDPVRRRLMRFAR